MQSVSLPGCQRKIFPLSKLSEFDVELVDLKCLGDGKIGGREVLIEDIRKQILLENYIITFHAHRRMDERGISTDDLVNLILDGSIIEDYPNSKPCPSVLVTGIVGWRPCHAVVALCENHLRVITVYWPEDEKWMNDTTRRRN